MSVCREGDHTSLFLAMNSLDDASLLALSVASGTLASVVGGQRHDDRVVRRTSEPGEVAAADALLVHVKQTVLAPEDCLL